jgi:Na+/H+-dicarboxylate symporter
MIDVIAASGDAAKELNNKVHLILDAAMPPFQAETDMNVQVNAIAMLMALVLRRVNPDQREDFMKAFEGVTRVHFEALNTHIAKRATEMFFDLIRAAFTMGNPGNDTTH